MDINNIAVAEVFAIIGGFAKDVFDRIKDRRQDYLDIILLLKCWLMQV